MNKCNEFDFHPISIDDREWINNKLKKDTNYTDNLFSCEYSFASNFTWRKIYKVEVAELFGCGIFKYTKYGNCAFSFPFGDGDKRAVIEYLMNNCQCHNCNLSMYPVLENQRMSLIKWFPGKFEIEGNRDNYDYVYTTERLSLLQGRKLHGKRNHIARFKENNQWLYEPLNNTNKNECMEMCKLWADMREEKWSQDMENEMSALNEALIHFEELGLVGGLIRVEESIVAFSIAEEVSHDTLVVHYEKAYPMLQGAYPMINQQLVLNEGEKFKLINREEDTGDEGLRKAKLSYYPEMLLKKYTATESKIVYASEFDREQIISLWHDCFGDDRRYIEFYLDNRLKNDNMLVIYRDGRPVSMASILMTTILIKGEKYKAGYIYAVGTHPDYRGRGLASELIRHIQKKLQGYLILQPENEGLSEYYHKLGFNTFVNKCDTLEDGVHIEKYEMDKLLCMGQNQPQEAEQKWIVKDVTPEKYKQIRDAYFEMDGYVKWDNEAIKYALCENELCKGKAIRIKNLQENEEYIVLYRIQKKSLCILESTLKLSDYPDVCKMLFDITNTDCMHTENGTGMVWTDFDKSEEIKYGYLNLTLA